MKKSGLMQETMSTRKPRQKKLGLEGEKRYDWIAISFEETIHQECSFQEYCLYDMANIETTSSVLGWNCPKLQLYTINLIISLYLVFLISAPCDRIYFKPLKTKRAHIGQAAIFFLETIKMAA